MADEVYYDTFNIFGKSYPLSLSEGEVNTREKILLVATTFFTKKGYSSVSLKEIAKVIGIRPASLYYYFESKEALCREVFRHAKELYLLYFRSLEEILEKADSFEAVLEALFLEPKRLANIFTCYAFSMIQVEQFNDRYAGEVFNDIFLRYSIEFVQGWFDKCIERGLVAKFDTRTVAAIIVHTVLIGLEVSVHKEMGRIPAYDPKEVFADLQQFILFATRADSHFGRMPSESAAYRRESHGSVSGF